jgi:small conductance mechanosensitive channel
LAFEGYLWLRKGGFDLIDTIRPIYAFLQKTGPGANSRSFDGSVILQSLLDLWTSFLAQLPYLLLGLIVFGVFVVLSRIVKRILGKAGRGTRLPPNLADLMARLGSALVILLGIFVAAVVVFPAFTPGNLVAGLGISSVAIGFAFKDILQNFLAGILLLWRQPFVVGDQIRSGGFEGTVEAIDVRATRLKTYDGERVILPNGEVYTKEIVVRTAFDRRRVHFEVGIGYPDSIEEARKVIHAVLAKTEGVLDEPAPCVYVGELAPSSVNFDVYFWAQSKQANVLEVRDRVATGIKLALDAAGIDMPFPHTVVMLPSKTGGGESKDLA